MIMRYDAFREGEELDRDFLDEQNNWDDTAETLAAELATAGVNPKETAVLARYLISAYDNRLNLFISGHNAEDVANALSVSLFGRMAAVMDISFELTSETINKAETSPNSIIVVKGILSCDRVDRIIDYSVHTGKYLIAISPIEEELFIEPQGLFGYFYPLLTNNFVVAEKCRDFIGGIKKTTYFSVDKSSVKRISATRRLGMSGILQSRISLIANELEQMGTAGSTDVIFRYCLYPYAIVTNQYDLLIDLAGEENSLSTDTIRFLSK